MQPALALVFAITLIAGAPAVAASYAHGPAASTARPYHKPCGKPRRRGCWIQISSFQFGVGRGDTAPTHGASGREAGMPSVGEITVHKPKRKRP
jgi:hypothetical protein